MTRREIVFVAALRRPSCPSDDDPLHAVHAALPKLSEDFSPRVFGLHVAHAPGKHLALARAVDADHGQHGPADHAAMIARFHIAGIDHDVRPNIAVQAAFTEGRQGFVHFRSDLRDRGGRQVEAAHLLQDLAHLARRYAHEIHLRAGGQQRPLAALVARESQRMIGFRAARLRHFKVQLAQARVELTRFVAVALTLAIRAALVALGTQMARNFFFHDFSKHNPKHVLQHISVRASLNFVQIPFRIALLGHRAFLSRFGLLSVKLPRVEQTMASLVQSFLQKLSYAITEGPKDIQSFLNMKECFTPYVWAMIV